MKLHVLHDARGRILAAVPLNEDNKTAGPRPVPRRGQKTLEVEVPAEHAHQDLLTICHTMRVHASSRSLMLAKKMSTRGRRTASSTRRKKK
jgi:hypothetical protein